MKNCFICNLKKTLLIFSVVFAFASCNFVSSFTEHAEGNTTLKFDKTSTNISIGSMDVINLTASNGQNSRKITWEYDPAIVFCKTDNYGAVITGLSPGDTKIVARCNDSEVSCYVSVSNETYAVNITNPYVYASTDYVDVKPGKTVKVSAALFGGTSADINGFTWSTDVSNVVSLITEGNYCWITGVNDGFTKLTVRHTKSSFGYSVLVNCSTDGTMVSYITTTDNIITINKSERLEASFTVDLENHIASGYESGFTYKVVDSLGNDMASAPVTITGAGSTSCTVTANSIGNCYVRCEHPNASYSLDILVRVIENAETAYIEPSSSILTLSGETSEKLSLELVNYSGIVEADSFSWTFPPNATEYLSYETYNGSTDTTGDSVRLTGKKTGSVKIEVSYPGVPTRSIVVLIRDILSEASSATTYITTDQNYIKLGTNDESFKINVMLKNCSAGDINNLNWKIVNTAADGSNSDVIKWTSGNGTSTSKSSSRSAAFLTYSESAFCLIEPCNVGTAYIDVSHPKSMYPTRISIVVTDGNSTVEPKSYLSLKGSPIVNIKNGNTANVSVNFSGIGNSDTIEWNIVGNASVSGNGTDAVITAPMAGSGGSVSTLKVSHENSEYPVTYTIACYDTENELNNLGIKAIYSIETHKTLSIDESTTLSVSKTGFTEEPNIRWTVTEGLNSVISATNSDKNYEFNVKALEAGKATIKVSCDGCDDVIFLISVKDADTIDDTQDCYLSTTNNVVYFTSINESKDISVFAHNINSASYDKIEWSVSNSDFTVSANGNNATITANASTGSAVLTVKHPVSMNELTINLKSGNQYEYINPDICFITTDTDTLDLFAGQDEVMLTAKLNHTEISDAQEITKGFTFESSDTKVAEVSYITNTNVCYVRPIAMGTAKITVHHADSDFDKEVIVIVNKVANSDSIPYITTKTNVITVIQGEHVMANVLLKNSDSVDSSLWTWKSSDPKIADVIANNGTTSMVSGNKPGTTEIKVSHKDCLYSLKLIVIVLDSSIVATRPYIKTSENIITIQKGKSFTLNSEMIGGNGASDNIYFKWNGSNSSLLLVNGAANTCYVRALNTGMCYITVKNSKYIDSVSKTVLVIIEENQVDGCYIKPSQNIIKLQPDITALTTVSATLVNGEVTDGEKFIWWVDDYNLVGITSLAEQCSIIPTGRSGTTKLHVKHEKASSVCDFIIMVSKYDTFTFSSKSASITAGKLNFFSLQVPAIENEYKIVYSSSNPDVCIIDGSKTVAVVSGQNYGTASLSAVMQTTDGTVIAKTEMLVTVTKENAILPVVSLGQSIMTLEAGTSQTFTASISGKDISAQESYNLKWTIQNPDSGISFLDQSADFSAYGSSVYVTVTGGGINEYILTCTHEKTGATSSMYVIVEEKGAIIMNLSTYFIEMYKDDGSQSISVKLTNGTESDYKNVSWSAIKVGMSSIVAVSKTKGKTCTITPKNIGQTTVVAKLPTGQSVNCVVVVKAAAEVTVSTGTVHVIPGYTERIKYKTTPENANLVPIVIFSNYSADLAGNSPKYFDVDIDTSKKEICITGLSEYPNSAAGTITLTMAGTSSANMPKINVFVTWDVQVEVLNEFGSSLTQIKNDKPDTANVKKFQVMYYPKDLVVDIKSPNESLVTVGTKEVQTITDNGVNKSLMTVTLVPHSEGNCEISVTGAVPNSTSHKETKKFDYSAYYSTYDIIPVFDKIPAGAFTNYNEQDNILTLADGEEALFYVKIANENASGRITGIKYRNCSGLPEYGETNNKDIYDTSKERLERKKKIFDFDITNDVKNCNNLPINKGLIYIAPEGSSSSTGQNYYRIRHCWDFYKELNSGGNWNPNCISESNADWYMVSKELVALNGSKMFYTIPHKSVSNSDVMTVSWEMMKADTDDAAMWMGHHWWRRERMRALTNNFGEVYYIKNNGNSYHNGFNWSGAAGGRFQYRDCIPYVISKSELINNQFFYLPYTCLKYSHIRTYTFGSDDERKESIYFNKMCNQYITPTIDRSNTDHARDGGKNPNAETSYLEVICVDANNKPLPNLPRIDMRFVKYYCQAYTNGNWRKEAVTYPNGSRYEHYVTDDKVFYPSHVQNVAPYFYVDKNSVTATTEEVHANTSIIEIPYMINPSSGKLYVTIPDCNGKKSLTLGSASFDSSSNSYVISSHNSVTDGKAEGVLKFVLDGEYKGNVSVKAIGNGLNATQYIDFELYDKNAYYVPSITSKVPYLQKDKYTGNSNISEYSSVDSDSHMIIVGDGESINGKIKLSSSYANRVITSVTFEKASSSTNPASDNTVDGALTGSTQTDLVDVEATLASNKTEINFTINHKKDYGYFGYKGGNVDSFFRYEPTTDDVVIDESIVKYDIVYVLDENGKVTDKFDLDTTAKNKEEAIAKAKENALEDLRKGKLFDKSIKNSYNYPFYYSKNDFYNETKEYPVTPIGIIKLTSYSLKSNEEVTEVILVGAQIRNCPCATTDSYGY